MLCIVFCLRKLSDGMFLESCRAVAKQYPSIEYTELGMHNTILQVGVGAAKGGHRHRHKLNKPATTTHGNTYHR